MQDDWDLESEDYRLLSKINNPNDLKSLTQTELNELCKEIRNKIIWTISKNGGHLASNLGIVELTVSLHKVFTLPKDKIVWDTGHQGYAHKLLTGRFKNFDSLRKKNGISSFIDPSESEYDMFISGHAANAISAALGIARAEILKNSKNTVIAIVGDGSLTSGLAYEGLNNASGVENLIIILNWNNMSISKTVGSLSEYVRHILKNSKKGLKKEAANFNIFSDMGYEILNFVDGHNIDDLVEALNFAKKIKKTVILPIVTKKGKGYANAEKEPENYHSVLPFNLDKDRVDFSRFFGNTILELAEKDDKICVITAAMGVGTGLLKFKERFPNRYFDVGIAEEHAVTFAAGLSIGGMIPIFAVYSTFLQRAYDQLLHDVAIENTHIVIAIDRAGIGEDGKTHQGVFDVAFLTTIPNVIIYSPVNYEELRIALKKAIYEEKGLVAVRYPKGEELKTYKNSECEDYLVFGESEIAVVTYGILFKELNLMQQDLKKNGVDVVIIRINKIFPIVDGIINQLKKYKEIFFFEEGVKNSGIGEHLMVKLLDNGFCGRFHLKAIDGVFVEQSTVKEAFKSLGFDYKSIANEILSKSFIVKNIYN